MTSFGYSVGTDSSSHNTTLYAPSDGRIECDGCHRPAMTLQGDHLVVKYRHDGQLHETWVPVKEVFQRWQDGQVDSEGSS